VILNNLIYTLKIFKKRGGKCEEQTYCYGCRRTYDEIWIDGIKTRYGATRKIEVDRNGNFIKRIT
jgi:hypothetical protein